MPRREIASPTRFQHMGERLPHDSGSRSGPELPGRRGSRGLSGRGPGGLEPWEAVGYRAAGGLAALGTFSQSARNFLMPDSVSGWLASWVMTL